jgi:hypothetical protein
VTPPPMPAVYIAKVGHRNRVASENLDQIPLGSNHEDFQPLAASKAGGFGKLPAMFKPDRNPV